MHVGTYTATIGSQFVSHAASTAPDSGGVRPDVHFVPALPGWPPTVDAVAPGGLGGGRRRLRRDPRPRVRARPARLVPDRREPARPRRTHRPGRQLRQRRYELPGDTRL